jgi:predicted regulator of Ras-like GTPase activity (Roadblock/LC7/MglB family)
MINKVLYSSDSGETSLDKVLLNERNTSLISQGEATMKATLEELKNIMNGIVGSFVINGNGDVVAQNLPDIMAEKASKISKLIFYTTGVMKSTTPFERIIMDSENVKIITIVFEGGVLVVLAEKEINLPLLKLVSKITVSRLRGDNYAVKRKVAFDEVNQICNIYDLLFGLAAKKLFEIFGSEAAEMFDDKLGDVREDHPKLLSNVSFGQDGKPKIAKIKMNASKLNKDEILSGLEDILVSMLETLKDTAGTNIADKAIDRIIKLKDERQGEIQSFTKKR